MERARRGIRTLRQADRAAVKAFRPVDGRDDSCFHPPRRYAGSADDGTRPDDCIPPSRCCKICSTGKACGDSCISRDKTCHKGRGCACNRSEVCTGLRAFDLSWFSATP